MLTRVITEAARWWGNPIGRRQWVTAAGIKLPRLVKRRAEERVLCETGV